MEYIVLNNGVKMPILGYGTYQISPRITERCVLDAIKVGYLLLQNCGAVEDIKILYYLLRNL